MRGGFFDHAALLRTQSGGGARLTTKQTAYAQSDMLPQREVHAVRLRDRRRPGHYWQDNELIDVFQPVIGALAVNVYVNLTRDVYGGETRVRYSVRKLAKATPDKRWGGMCRTNCAAKCQRFVRGCNSKSAPAFF